MAGVPAPSGSPLQRPATRRGTAERALDMRLKMREDTASGVPLDDGLDKGGEGRLKGEERGSFTRIRGTVQGMLQRRNAFLPVASRRITPADDTCRMGLETAVADCVANRRLS